MPDLRVSFPKPCSEQWEDMAPVGRDRICARCDKVIHDLSQCTIEQAEALLRAGTETCVRARIDADGVVALAPSRSMRRMVLAAGAAASLLAAVEPAVARQKGPQGVIAGKIRTNDWNTRVTATAGDGKSYNARVKPDGRYRLKKLPAGTYTLTFVPACGNSWTIDRIVVSDSEVAVPETPDPNECIIIGMLVPENNRG